MLQSTALKPYRQAIPVLLAGMSQCRNVWPSSVRMYPNQKQLLHRLWLLCQHVAILWVSSWIGHVFLIPIISGNSFPWWSLQPWYLGQPSCHRKNRYHSLGKYTSPNSLVFSVLHWEYLLFLQFRSGLRYRGKLGLQWDMRWKLPICIDPLYTPGRK